jgi:hypothetical protein
MIAVKTRRLNSPAVPGWMLRRADTVGKESPGGFNGARLFEAMTHVVSESVQ